MSTLVMYSLLTCPTCVAAREELAAQGVRYEERVLDGNADHQAELLRLTRQRTVPVFVKDGKVTIGFHGEHG